VITLYEDLTSILVPGVKFSPGKEGEEWVFTCIYTWKDDLDPTVKERSEFSLFIQIEQDANASCVSKA
jgi:hypothetical protein